MSKYEYSDDMAELSGFGGAYEAACRAMVVAGLEWLDANRTADPQFHGWEGVTGIIAEDNDDAKALTAAVIAPTKGDCTGAMHQAAISHILWIKAHSWDEYVADRKKRFAEEKGAA